MIKEDINLKLIVPPILLVGLCVAAFVYLKPGLFDFNKKVEPSKKLDTATVVIPKDSAKIASVSKKPNSHGKNKPKVSGKKADTTKTVKQAKIDSSKSDKVKAIVAKIRLMKPKSPDQTKEYIKTVWWGANSLYPLDKSASLEWALEGLEFSRDAAFYALCATIEYSQGDYGIAQVHAEQAMIAPQKIASNSREIANSILKKIGGK